MYVTNFPEIETEIGRLNDRYTEKNLLKRPFIIILGPDITQIDEYLVYFGDVYYRFRSFLKALDVCFKFFKTYELSFPRECTGPWDLVNHSLYGFNLDTKYNKLKITRILNLIRAT